MQLQNNKTLRNLVIFYAGTMLRAIVFGQIRQATESVWPVVLLHGISNAAGYAILEGKLITFNNELLGNIVPGSITVTLLFSLIALLIGRNRHRNPSQRVEQKPATSI